MMHAVIHFTENLVFFFKCANEYLKMLSNIYEYANFANECALHINECPFALLTDI